MAFLTKTMGTYVPMVFFVPEYGVYLFFGEGGSIMKRILGYMKQYWYYYFFGGLVMLIGITLDLFTPIVTGKIIDDVFEKGQVELFEGLVLALIGITVGRAIFGYAKEILFDVVGAKVICKLRLDLFDHIQSLSFGFFLIERIRENLCQELKTMLIRYGKVSVLH